MDKPTLNKLVYVYYI